MAHTGIDGQLLDELAVVALRHGQGFGRERYSAPVGAHGSTDFEILGELFACNMVNFDWKVVKKKSHAF